MKLSEAIREGAKLRPQASEHMFNKIDDIWGSCALGAAREAIFGIGPTDSTTSENDMGALSHAVDIDFNQHFYDPVETQLYTSLHTILLRLNDKHNWTREQIANWLESIGQ